MSELIVRAPENPWGRPVFRGTRVPVAIPLESMEDGMTIDRILESYPSLNRDDLVQGLENARQLITAA